MKNHADFEPVDGTILLAEWLKYGVKHVPAFYAQVLGGREKGAKREEVQLVAYRRSVGQVLATVPLVVSDWISGNEKEMLKMKLEECLSEEAAQKIAAEASTQMSYYLRDNAY